MDIYTIPACRRGIVISEVESAEELVKTLNEMPGAYLVDFEMYPLADFNESMKYVIESLKRAEQQFPAAPR